ncbi:hypothetical protein TIFTF001_048514 [Ficus carica]|uniref:Uncharacterized protein n=1 Tax=Ficus carica TaxID=3494 RepID=A0AA88CJG8_FICCA|nr:hypothetical protein TIFTF001_048514 [Ficus carica]
MDWPPQPLHSCAPGTVTHDKGPISKLRNESYAIFIIIYVAVKIVVLAERKLTPYVYAVGLSRVPRRVFRLGIVEAFSPDLLCSLLYWSLFSARMEEIVGSWRSLAITEEEEEEIGISDELVEKGQINLTPLGLEFKDFNPSVVGDFHLIPFRIQVFNLPLEGMIGNAIYWLG